MNKWGLAEKRGFVEQFLYKYGKIISPRSNGLKTVSCLSSLPMINEIKKYIYLKCNSRESVAWQGLS